ncbi:hypothetical protein BDW59DRAFT_153220 [Aspergillus cavernicola]|uniref:Uncharacterized protein n=1 Tax=Aspergillus cavernicola TaxID=176166 RepID=A0ABR4HLP7_9EURO
MFEPSQRLRLTVLVSVYRDRDVTRRDWVGIARDIKAFLSQEGKGKGMEHVVGGGGAGDVAVEIIDPRFDQCPCLLPCAMSDPISRVWPKLGPAIVDNIDTTGVLTVGCYRVATSDKRSNPRKCPVTVIFGVDYWVDRDWKKVRDAVVRKLDSAGLSTVGVLVRVD